MLAKNSKDLALGYLRKHYILQYSFSQARERSKTTIVDLIHVARLITRELANRTAEERGNAELIDLWFVLKAN
ncbi:MAG: hypothetical protein CM15mP49_20640 [Actinomycetota bacterium]|nr:MAG: hypothetical protein CM15mP49_20640 [Actinomycetota bacterium]